MPASLIVIPYTIQANFWLTKVTTTKKRKNLIWALCDGKLGCEVGNEARCTTSDVESQIVLTTKFSRSTIYFTSTFSFAPTLLLVTVMAVNRWSPRPSQAKDEVCLLQP